MIEKYLAWIVVSLFYVVAGTMRTLLFVIIAPCLIATTIAILPICLPVLAIGWLLEGVIDWAFDVCYHRFED